MVLQFCNTHNFCNRLVTLDDLAKLYPVLVVDLHRRKSLLVTMQSLIAKIFLFKGDNHRSSYFCGKDTILF